MFDVGQNVLRHQKVYLVHGNDWRLWFNWVCHFDIDQYWRFKPMYQVQMKINHKSSKHMHNGWKHGKVDNFWSLSPKEKSSYKQVLMYWK